MKRRRDDKYENISQKCELLSINEHLKNGITEFICHGKP